MPAVVGPLGYRRLRDPRFTALANGLHAGAALSLVLAGGVLVWNGVEHLIHHLKG